MSPFIEVQGPALDKAERVVVVIHGMSTTVETLKQGYPATNDGITKVYWRLPVLREGADALKRRRDGDVLRDLFAPVVSESRSELKGLLADLGDKPVGLFGFSIGSLVALWGAVDNPGVRAVVTVGGVPNLGYLQHYYPTDDWDDVSVTDMLAQFDVCQRVGALSKVAILIMHGEADEVARWEWMQPLADALSRQSSHVQVQKFSHVRHRLWGEDPEEIQQLSHLRKLADRWYLKYLMH